MNYLVLKQLHMGLAIVSISGFVLRWTWQLRQSPLISHAVTRIAPHVVDTLLLLAGVILAVLSNQYPWSHAWLGVKVAGLLAYILLGMAAMSLQSRRGQTLAFVLAVVTFLWMISVARTKSPLGVFQALL